MIMPLVLTVIFFLLSFGFYEHDKAVFIEQNFYEARNISMYGEAKKMENNIKKLCLSAKGIGQNHEESIIKTSVESKGTVHILMLRRSLELNVKEDYVKCYAPDLIRVLNVGMNIKDYVTDRKVRSVND